MAGAEAEVAFVVADPWQGRGLAPLLLDRLADRARSRGIERFVAETLSDNRAMLAVFRASGLAETSSLIDPGVVRVEMSLLSR